MDDKMFCHIDGWGRKLCCVLCCLVKIVVKIVPMMSGLRWRRGDDVVHWHRRDRMLDLNWHSLVEKKRDVL